MDIIVSNPEYIVNGENINIVPGSFQMKTNEIETVLQELNSNFHNSDIQDIGEIKELNKKYLESLHRENESNREILRLKRVIDYQLQSCTDYFLEIRIKWEDDKQLWSAYCNDVDISENITGIKEFGRTRFQALIDFAKAWEQKCEQEKMSHKNKYEDDNESKTID